MHNINEVSENMPMRSKYWKELNQKEKIERIRQEVKILQRMVYEMVSDVRLLNRHTHKEDGTAIVEQKLFGHNTQEAFGNPIEPKRDDEDEVYF